MVKEYIDLDLFMESVNTYCPNVQEMLNIKDSVLEYFQNEQFNEPCDDGFPYTFIEQFEQRGDGSGYETYYVFERKSDAKLFYYYIYDGRFENYSLEECTRALKMTWSFECNY